MRLAAAQLKGIGWDYWECVLNGGDDSKFSLIGRFVVTDVEPSHSATLDWSASALQLQAASAEKAVIKGWDKSGRRVVGTMLVERDPSTDWSEVVLRVMASAPEPKNAGAGMSSHIALPYELPEITQTTLSRTPTALIHVRGATSKQLILAGVASESLTSGTWGSMLSMGIIAESGTSPVLIGARLELVVAGAVAAPQDRELIAESLRHVVAWSEQFFGRQIAGRIVVLLHDGETIYRSGILLARPVVFGLGTPPTFPWEFDIVASVAMMWLGEGCRLVGTRGTSVAMGIGHGISLYRLRVLGDETYLGQAIRALQQGAKKSDSEWAASASHPSQAGIAKLALSVFEALKARPETARQIQDFTNDNWGYTVSERELMTAVAQWGVSVPTAMLRR